MKKIFWYVFGIVFIFVASRGLAQETEFFQKLVSLHQTKKDFGSTSWMTMNPQEEGQTFSDYQKSKLPKPDAAHPYIYIVLLGDFSDTAKDILQKTSRYIQIYFQTPVKFLDPIPLSQVPPEARRKHPQTGDPQILTTHVIEKMLIPIKPKDAYCLIAFTSSDLWPGKG